MPSQIMRDIMYLSSGTISTLCDSRDMGDIDKWHTGFIQYVARHTFDMWKSWQDAYVEYSRYIDTNTHEDEKAFEEAVKQASRR
jgi:hypothetical protein